VTLRTLLEARTPFVVMDLEFTAWPGSVETGWSRPGEFREIVQIGAVRLSGHLTEEAELCAYVRPQRNPVLSRYFIELTGISQRTVDGQGLQLTDALRRLSLFAIDAPIISNGGDGDLILENCHLAGIASPLAADRFLDIRAELSAMLGLRGDEADSYRLPEAIGLPKTAAHDALADARAVADAIRFNQRFKAG
jgi:inhibitor of KinA sporulation pathway (predicted exonuclease)